MESDYRLEFARDIRRQLYHGGNCEQLVELVSNISHDDVVLRSQCRISLLDKLNIIVVDDAQKALRVLGRV